MMLNGIKILIGDDSILARKQLKDIVSTYGTPVFLEASMDRTPSTSTKKSHLNWFSLILSCL